LEVFNTCTNTGLFGEIIGCRKIRITPKTIALKERYRWNGRFHFGFIVSNINTAAKFPFVRGADPVDVAKESVCVATILEIDIPVDEVVFINGELQLCCHRRW
jgi:hypothetical protein